MMSLKLLARFHNRIFTGKVGFVSRQQIRFSNLKKLDEKAQDTQEPKEPPEQKSQFNWKPVVIAGIGGLILYRGYHFYVEKKEIKSGKAVLKERRRILGENAIGGQWELVDSKGNLKKSEDFQGQWLLIYFGYTHGVNRYPRELEKLLEVTKTFDTKPDYPKLQPIFITVDPLRDTPAVVDQYISEFSSNVIGLTGSVSQVKDTCRKFRVYFSASPKRQDGSYYITHTILVYLVDPDGNFVEYYGQYDDAKEIADSVTLRMTKFHNTDSIMARIYEFIGFMK